MIKLSLDQKNVLSSLLSWYKDNKGKATHITLGGYAGTGKTTLISVLRKRLYKQDKKLKVAFVSFTGKAARVLRLYLRKTGAFYKNDFVGTIHSLIYSPIVNEKEEIIGWQKKDEIRQNLIIIDEASMVDAVIWKDLISYKVTVIAVGDHGQLPPIRGNFNLIKKPQLKLKKIHRQAQNNPIIKLSIFAREKGFIPFGKYDQKVYKIRRDDYDGQETIEELLRSYKKDTLILCGYNFTRVRLNNFIRGSLGFDSLEPVSSDRVICLRNNYNKNIFNGMLGTIRLIKKSENDWYYTNIQMDDEQDEFSGLISKKQFNATSGLNFTKKRSEIKKGDLFDFGYALTVHKAQGSQARRVILFEERFAKMDDKMWRRWLYTAVTRAESELYIIGSQA